MADIKDILASISPVERTVMICLDGKLGDRQSRLEEQFQAAFAYDLQHNEPDTAPGIAAELEALELEVAAATVPFVCRALPSRGEGSWRALIEAFPPPEDNEYHFIFDPETFPPAAVAATVVDPVMSVDDAVALTERLSTGQWDKLWSAVWAVNAGDDLVPKSDVGTAYRRSFETNSDTAAPEESLTPST